jgi:hypothetical protein
VKIVPALAIVVTALALGSTGVSAAAVRQTTPRSVAFHLIEKQFGFNFVDNPPRQGRNAAPLMGDQFVFSSELRTRGGAHAGWLDATCVVSRGGPNGTGPCYGVFSLEGGQLTAIAQFTFQGNTTHVAIVGGTGVYAGASGTVDSVSRSENSPFTDDTFHLLVP